LADFLPLPFREKLSLSPSGERVGERGVDRRREGPWGIPLSGVAPEGYRVRWNTFYGTNPVPFPSNE
jgi:hypothetical protein